MESYFLNKSASRVQPLVPMIKRNHSASMPVMIDIMEKALYFNHPFRRKP